MAQVLTGIQICEQSEGYARELPDGSVVAYWDALGCVWTCGYGTTGPDVVQDTHWDRQTSVQRLQVGWSVARAGVLRASPCLADPANFNRLDAINDFAYNEGVGRYQASSLRTYVNRGNWRAAASEFGKWTLAGGKVQAGLVTRRHLEMLLFLAPVAISQSQPSPVAVPDDPTSADARSSIGTLVLAFLRSLLGLR